MPYVVPFKENDLPHFAWEVTDQYYEHYHGYTHLEKTGIKPMIPYGYGLSYKSFDIVAPTVDTEENQIIVKTSVSNTGKLDGDEIVQVYVCFQNSSVDRPVKQLCGFQRVSVKAGEIFIV